MTTANQEQPLTLSIKNFGPISEAEIDLRPLSVFIGPSNTGKSYMAVLIYALHRFFEQYSAGLRNRTGVRFRTNQSGSLSVAMVHGHEFSREDIDNLLDWAVEVNLEQPSRLRGSLPNNELPEFVAALIRPILRGVAQYSEVFDAEVARCFGVEQCADLIQYPGSGEAEISIGVDTLGSANRNGSLHHEVQLSASGTRIQASLPSDLPLRIWRGGGLRNIPFRPVRVNSGASQEQVLAQRAAQLIGGLSSAVLSSMADPIGGSAYYLPADRAGVMHAHRVVVRSLIARASRAGLRPEPALPALSGVLGDFLEQLIDMEDYVESGEDSDSDPSTRLENIILGGSVVLEKGQTGYPSFAYRPGNWDRDLPLMNASSMVSEMAPVVLYLRHVVGLGDLLIIEEPESHLHPEMQVAFIRELAAVAKSGIRVIITTHSEWVLEELANLVLLSELPEDAREGIPGSDVALTPAEVGAWLFEHNSELEGSEVKEIRLDKDTGTFPARYGIVTEDLYNRFATISNRIEEMGWRQQS